MFLNFFIDEGSVGGSFECNSRASYVEKPDCAMYGWEEDDWKAKGFLLKIIIW